MPKKDTQFLIVLLALSFVSVYFMPSILNKLIFLMILIAVYITKFDYVSLVWFFIINDAPGRLFGAGGGEETMRIPIYTLTSGISISFKELFILVFIVKAIKSKQSLKFLFKKDFTLYVFFGILVFLYSFFMGVSINTFIGNFRYLLPWSFIFIIPLYVKNREILERVYKFLFPMVFLAIMSQVFSYIAGDFLDNVLRNAGGTSLALDTTEKISRSSSAVYIILLVIIQAFYFYYNRTSHFKKTYLNLIIFFSILSVFLTATRGWILSLSIFLLGMFFVFGFINQINQIVRISVILIFSLIILVPFYPPIQKQIVLSYERFLTLQKLAEGDITAGGTMGRLDVRKPRVMKKFWENPVLGWGFSDEYHEYADGHVGNYNLMLNLGIVGFILIIGFFIHLCLKIYKLSMIPFIRKKEGKSLLIFFLGLISVFIIHSTSTQFWGYVLHFDQLPKILFFSFLFTSFSILYLNNFKTKNNITA